MTLKSFFYTTTALSLLIGSQAMGSLTQEEMNYICGLPPHTIITTLKNAEKQKEELAAQYKENLEKEKEIFKTHYEGEVEKRIEDLKRQLADKEKSLEAKLAQTLQAEKEKLDQAFHAKEKALNDTLAAAKAQYQQDLPQRTLEQIKHLIAQASSSQKDLEARLLPLVGTAQAFTATYTQAAACNPGTAKPMGFFVTGDEAHGVPALRPLQGPSTYAATEGPRDLLRMTYRRLTHSLAPATTTAASQGATLLGDYAERITPYLRPFNLAGPLQDDGQAPEAYRKILKEIRPDITEDTFTVADLVQFLLRVRFQ